MDGDVYSRGVWCVTANSAIQGLLRGKKEADKGEGRKTARGLCFCFASDFAQAKTEANAEK